LTWLRKRGLVRKVGTAWRLTAKGRRALVLIAKGVAKPWV
jgi:ribosomal protein S19E (S16A)